MSEADWFPRLLDTAPILRPEPEPEPEPTANGRTPESTAYGLAALRNECDAVIAAPDGDQNNRLNRAAFAAGQLVAGGELAEAETVAALEAAAAGGHHPRRRATSTIRSGFTSGMKQPRSAARDDPELGTPAAPTTAEAAPNEIDRLLPLVRWPAFYAAAEDEPRYLIERVLPAGVFLLGAEPKAGKTWLGLAMAVCIVAGQPWAGFAVPQAGPVVYVALESSRPFLKARIACLARGVGVADPGHALDDLIVLYRPPGFNLSEPRWAAMLLQRIRETGAALVMVDTLRAGATIPESNEGARAFAALLALLAPALADGVSVAFLHHFSKLTEGRQQRAPADRLTGSGALRGHMDAGLFVTGYDRRDHRFRLEHETRDGVALEPFGVRLAGTGTGVGGAFTRHDAAQLVADAELLTDTTVVAPAGEIAAWIREQTDGRATPKQIRDQFGISRDTLLRRRPLIEANGIEYVDASSLSHYRTVGDDGR